MDKLRDYMDLLSIMLSIMLSLKLGNTIAAYQTAEKALKEAQQ